MALSRTPQPNGHKLGRFELLRELVTSNVGTSWLAAPDDGASAAEAREVTIHKVHKHMAKAPSVVEALVRAAEQAKDLQHTNVLAVLDAGVQEGEPWVAVEYGGESLANVLRLAGADGLPVPVALRIAIDVIEGFSAAHAHQPALGHGEVGPWCVYIASDGVARVSGFQFDQALWRFGAHYVKNLERLSYAAPERVRAMSSTLGQNLSVADEESDLFSVAALVFELVTKQRLFASKMEAAVVQKVLTSTIPQASSVRADLPAEVNDALKKALSRDRGERFKTFDEFATALEAAGTAFIATRETVAELVQAARASGAKAAPAARGTMPFSDRMSAAPKPTSSAATPTPPPAAAQTPAPAPVRTPATTVPMAGALPRPPLAPRTTSTAGMQAVSPQRNGATLPGAGEAGPVSQRPKLGRLPAKTLLGFGKDLTPSQPPVADTAPEEAPNPRASSVELTDADMVEEEAKPAKAAPAAPPATNGVPGAPIGGRKRTATLLGIQAPVDEILPIARPVATTEPLSPRAPFASDATTEPKAPTKATQPVPVPKAKLKTRAGHRGHGIDQIHPGAVLEAQGAAYELIAPIARGGMAVVWAGREVGSSGEHGMGTRLGNMVAIKTMLPELVDEEDFETMFVDESRVAAKIQHRNVAGILGLGQADDLLYIAMEWVDGETLSTIQQAAVPLGGIPANILVSIAAQTAAGLYAAHQLKDDAGNSLELIHRDISPANVLLSRAGVAKIVDFGIAKSKGRLHVTRASGLVKGKTPYLSPEQIGGLPIDHRSDLFSLGVLLYVLATGKHPFRGDTEIQTLENIAIHAPKPLRQVDEEVTPGFERIVLKLLEKDPKRRYQNAREVELDLRALDVTFERPASEADVAAFVAEAVGDKLDARRKMLEEAVEGFSPKSDERAPETPSGFEEESTIDERASGVSAKELVDKVEVARQAADASSAAEAGPTDEPIQVPAPGALPVFDFPNDESVDAPAPFDLTAPDSPVSSRPRPLAQGAAPGDADAVPSVKPRGRGQLLKLIVLGVVLGLLIVGGIELGKRLSASDSPPTGSAAPSASVAPTQPARESTSAAPPAASPTTPATETAPPASAPPSASAAPSAAPSAKPTAQPPTYRNPNRPPGTPPIAAPTGI
ncbi:MAG: protein kinase [Polyangiaceae bacterium]